MTALFFKASQKLERLHNIMLYTCAHAMLPPVLLDAMLYTCIDFQSSVASRLGSSSSTWTHLGIWYSHSQCLLNSICVAVHALQFSPGRVQVTCYCE